MMVEPLSDRPLCFVAAPAEPHLATPRQLAAVSSVQRTGAGIGWIGMCRLGMCRPRVVSVEEVSDVKRSTMAVFVVLLDAIEWC